MNKHEIAFVEKLLNRQDQAVSSARVNFIEGEPLNSIQDSGPTNADLAEMIADIANRTQKYPREMWVANEEDFSDAKTTHVLGYDGARFHGVNPEQNHISQDVYTVKKYKYAKDV